MNKLNIKLNILKMNYKYLTLNNRVIILVVLLIAQAFIVKAQETPQNKHNEQVIIIGSGVCGVRFIL